MNNLTKSFLSITLLLSTISIAQTDNINTQTQETVFTDTTYTKVYEDDIIDELLKSNQKHEDFKTAQNKLLSGIILGDINMIESALKSGADLAIADENGNLPIHIAASTGDYEIIKYLIKAGASAEAALTCGIDRRLLLENKNQDSARLDSPLILALEGRSYRTARILIENGADIHARDTHGYTALQIASAIGASDIVELLIEYGAQINPQDIASEEYELSDSQDIEPTPEEAT